MSVRSQHYCRLYFVAAALLLASSLAAAQPALPGRETTAASVAAYPFRSTCRSTPRSRRHAADGMRYYIQPDGEPARRAELRLVVKDGFAFSKTTTRGGSPTSSSTWNSRARTLPWDSPSLDFLSGLGLSIGPGRTRDRLRRRGAAAGPDRREGGLIARCRPRGLGQHAATLENPRIDRAAGHRPVRWRMNLGAGERSRRRFTACSLKDRATQIRPAIGDPNIDLERVARRFNAVLRDWYRPDLMAVIVVGDVNREGVKAMIKERFVARRAQSRQQRPILTFPITMACASRW